MGKKLTDAKRAAIKRYDATNTRQVHLKLNCKTDADILEHLEKQESIQGYIKDLIRVDMAGIHHAKPPIIKEVIEKTDKYDDVRFDKYCPNCNAYLGWEYPPKYCESCGQAIQFDK